MQYQRYCMQAISVIKVKDKGYYIQNYTAANHQHAEVLVNRKTGSRHILLINSISYIRDYLDHEHLKREIHVPYSI